MTLYVTVDAEGNITSGVLNAAATGALPGSGAQELTTEQAIQVAANPGRLWWPPGAPWPLVKPLPAPPPIPLPQRLAQLTAQKATAGVWFKAASAAQPALFLTDNGGRANIAHARQMVDDGIWPTDGSNALPAADGSFVVLTADEVKALSQQAALYVLGCSAHGDSLGKQLAAGQAPDITVGWPSQGTPPAAPAP